MRGKRGRALAALLAACGLLGVPAASASADVKQVTLHQTSPLSVPAGGIGSDAAVCPEGETILGGGLVGSTFVVLQSSDDSGRGIPHWLTAVYNHGPASAEFTSYAFCGSSRGRDEVRRIVERVGDPASFGGQPTVDAFAACRPSETLVGGGALVGPLADPDLTIGLSGPDPNNPRQWFVRGNNPNLAPNQSTTAYAYCAKADGADRVTDVYSRLRPRSPGAEGGTKDSFVSCREGDRRIGGGAYTVDYEASVSVSAPDPSQSDTWFLRTAPRGEPTLKVWPMILCAER
jgi:hypothetical protein